MDILEYLKYLGIEQLPTESEDGANVIDLPDSEAYGKMFSKLDKNADLDEFEDNQVLTEQGSSLIYESKSQPYILNLIADWDNDIYQLIINEIT